MKKHLIYGTMISGAILIIAMICGITVFMLTKKIFFEEAETFKIERISAPEVVGAKVISSADLEDMIPLEEISLQKIKLIPSNYNRKFFLINNYYEMNELVGATILTIFSSENERTDFFVRRYISPKEIKTKKGSYSWDGKCVLDTNSGEILISYQYTHSEFLAFVSLCLCGMTIFIIAKLLFSYVPPHLLTEF